MIALKKQIGGYQRAVHSLARWVREHASQILTGNTTYNVILKPTSQIRARELAGEILMLVA